MGPLEKRKLLRLGHKVTLGLPPRWAREHSLSQGDRVSVQPVDGSLRPLPAPSPWESGAPRRGRLRWRRTGPEMVADDAHAPLPLPGAPSSPETPGLLRGHLDRLLARPISLALIGDRGYESALGKRQNGPAGTGAKEITGSGLEGFCKNF